MDKIKELSKDISDCRSAQAGLSYKTISKKFGNKVTTPGVFIRQWKKLKDDGSWDDHKKGDRSSAETPITTNHIGNLLHHNGLKFCSAYKVPLLK